MSLEKPDDVGKALGPHSWHLVSLHLHAEDPGRAQMIPVARGMGLPGAVSRGSEKAEKSPNHSQDRCCPEWG